MSGAQLWMLDNGQAFPGDVILHEMFGYVGLTAASNLTLRIVAEVIGDGSA